MDGFTAKSDIPKLNICQMQTLGRDQANKWRNLELDLSKTARKAIKFGSVGTSWSVKNAHFASFTTD